MSVIEHLVTLWQRIAPAQLAIVCAADHADVAAELDRLGLPRSARIENPNPDRGMFSSVQCAAQWPGWNPDLTHWAIALGDQPLVSPSTLHALVDFAALNPAKICQPARKGRPRHPVFVPLLVLDDLASSNDHTLRQFLNARTADIRLLEIDDPGLDLDLDNPADYERALLSAPLGVP
jgi:CTP:molybdopterin cytidylyltransferase MocA